MRPPDDWPIPPDLGLDAVAIWDAVKEYTLTSPERVFGLSESVKYVVANQIPGALVECGVWKGGSVLAALRTLLSCKNTERDVYLFDTFREMPKPGEKDIDWSGASALEDYERYHRDSRLGSSGHVWLDEVRSRIATTGYPSGRVHFVQGRVEETLPAEAPGEIALLRLDTDWYESTLHELVHLYPRLVAGGVLIVDDYGHFEGARQAVDEYFAGATRPSGGRGLVIV